MKIVSAIELLEYDYDIKKIFFGYNDNVATPSFHCCKKGECTYSRLFYIKEGGHCFSHKADEEPFLKSQKGSILYIPSDFPYYSKWTLDDRIAYETVHFNIYIDGEEILLDDTIVEIISENENIYAELFAQMRREWTNGTPGFRNMCKAKLYELLQYIGINQKIASVKNKFSSIYPGIIFLENNCFENISVSQLSEMCHVSEKTFNRLFVKYKGIPPMRFQLQMRMNRAYEMLKSGSYTVAEVANAVGISDSAYFSRVFKKYIGIAPSNLIPK